MDTPKKSEMDFYWIS